MVFSWRVVGAGGLFSRRIVGAGERLFVWRTGWRSEVAFACAVVAMTKDRMIWRGMLAG